MRSHRRTRRRPGGRPPDGAARWFARLRRSRLCAAAISLAGVLVLLVAAAVLRDLDHRVAYRVRSGLPVTAVVDTVADRGPACFGSQELTVRYRAADGERLARLMSIWHGRGHLQRAQTLTVYVDAGGGVATADGFASEDTFVFVPYLVAVAGAALVLLGGYAWIAGRRDRAGLCG